MIASVSSPAGQSSAPIAGRGMDALGQGDFLRLLTVQMQQQDPFDPVDNKEMLAQMAQFSSLEQMNNIAGDMKSLNLKAKSSEAYSMIGKHVQAFNPETGRAVEGLVSHVVREADDIALVVNGEKVKMEDVHAVFAPTPEDMQRTARPAAQQQEQPAAKEEPVRNNQLNQSVQTNDTITKSMAARAYSAQAAAATQK